MNPKQTTIKNLKAGQFFYMLKDLKHPNNKKFKVYQNIQLPKEPKAMVMNRLELSYIDDNGIERGFRMIRERYLTIFIV